MPACVLGGAPFPPAKLFEERTRGLAFALVETALQKLQQHGRVPRGVGGRGRAFNTTGEPRQHKQVARVFEERAQTPSGRSNVVQSLFGRLAHESPARALQPTLLGSYRFREPLHRRRSRTLALRGSSVHYRRRSTRVFVLPFANSTANVRSSRVTTLVVLLVIVAAGTWYYLSHRSAGGPTTLQVYYTTLDGKTLGNLSVSLRPRQPGESAAEHLHNTVRYAAVEAVAGPPADVQAIRFPPGTQVLGVSVDGSTATVDLSKDVGHQAGGSFGENGEFKGLVYTVTGVAGIDAVQVTVEGEKLQTLPGGHLELDQPLHRSDW